MKNLIMIAIILTLFVPADLIAGVNWSHSINGSPADVPNGQDIAFSGTGANNAAWIATLYKVSGTTNVYLEQDTGSTTANGEFSGEYKLTDAGLSQWEGAAIPTTTLKSQIKHNLKIVDTVNFDSDL